MACEPIDLFTLLGGTPDPVGHWSYEGNTCSGDGILLLSEDGVSYFSQTVSVGEILEDPSTPGMPYSSEMWWDPEANDVVPKNTLCAYTFRYTVESSCGDPDTADVVWSLYKLDLYTDEAIELCPTNTNYSLLTLLRNAQAQTPVIPANNGNWTCNDPGPWFTQTNDDNGANDTFNPSLAVEGNTYIFTYTVVVPGTDESCDDCEDTVTLTIEVLPGSEAGTGGSITTCV